MRQNQKSILFIVSIVLIVTILSTVFIGCQKPLVHDPEFLNEVNDYNIWDNDAKNAVSQVNVSKKVRDFLNTPSENGKKKKVLFLGYDGCRVDTMQYIFDTKSGEKKADVNSGILQALSEEGSGLYLSYAGGEFPGSKSQATVTGAGWCSLLTGVWTDKHKVWDNMDVKNPKYKSFVLDAAIGTFNNGHVYTSTFISTTTMHFATQYLDELNYLRDNPKDGATMPEKQEHKYFIKEKGKWSESLYADKTHEYVNAIVPNTKVPAKYLFLEDDGENTEYPNEYIGDMYTKDEMIKAINNGTDVIFGILDSTDHKGHKFGFSGEDHKHTQEYINGFKYQEELAKDIVLAAQNRAKAENEDWLIILTTDHGGYNKDHGQQSLEERTTWVVCNKGFGKEYQATNYNGFKDEK